MEVNGMDSLWNDRLLKIMGIGQRTDEFDYEEGEHQVNHTPTVAEFAYQHTFYAPLDREDVASIPEERKRSIPQDVWALYAVFNGFHLYNASIHLYGLHNRKYLYQPFTLDASNGHDAPRGLRDDQFAFMGVYTSSNASGTLYMTAGDRRVHLCRDRTSTTPIVSWNHLGEALVDIITAAEQHYGPVATGGAFDFASFVDALMSGRRSALIP